MADTAVVKLASKLTPLLFSVSALVDNPDATLNLPEREDPHLLELFCLHPLLEMMR
jgi:hypothetical protein